MTTDPHAVAYLERVFAAHLNDPALFWRGRGWTFSELAALYASARANLTRDGIEAGDVVALEADFSPAAVALLLALVRRRAIVVPLARGNRQIEAQRAVACAQWLVKVDADDAVEIGRVGGTGVHALYDVVRTRGHAGLVLFTSGSAGTPKGAVHDAHLLFDKFHEPRPALRTLNFLLFDHWGGLNTLLHALSNGAAVVTVDERTPDSVAALIERFQVELLPASPSFLNLLLVSGAHERHDLSSLRLITYGTEPMPEHTLQRLARTFDRVKLQQTYGLIELGVLRSKSRDRDSLWVRVGGEGYATRIRDGLLEIKAQSAMLGYLNAPSPFTADGWFMTGDAVEADGEWLRILGRRSELINVGGEKVYPAEVESAIEEFEGVVEARVYGEPNAILGNIVCADVRLELDVPHVDFARRLKEHCRTVLQPFMVPVRISVVTHELTGDRFKKIRVAGRR
jgi:long-chain acyl-CoA synthetase